MIYKGTYTTVQVTKKIGFLTTSYAAVVAGELAYTDIISVKVEGETYNIILNGTPGDRLVNYANNIGMLLFKRELGSGKSVSVIYQK